MKKYLTTIVPILLSLVFLLLKVTKLIDWSWLIVWSPIILLVAFYVGVIIYIIAMKDDSHLLDDDNINSDIN
jgi:uncharacterized membrane protein YccC